MEEGCGAGILNRPDSLPPPEKKTPFVLFYIPELSFLFIMYFFFHFSLTWLPIGVRGGSKICVLHNEQKKQTESGIP